MKTNMKMEGGMVGSVAVKVSPKSSKGQPTKSIGNGKGSPVPAWKSKTMGRNGTCA